MFLAEGFSFNFDILETNLINILILIGLIVYVAKGFFTTTIEIRRQQIMKTLESLDENLLISNQKFLETTKQLNQINVIIEQLEKDHSNQKTLFLEKRYSLFASDINRLFDLAKQIIDKTSQDTFQFLQKYLITLVIGKLLINYIEGINGKSISKTEAAFSQNGQAEFLDLSVIRLIKVGLDGQLSM